jgi:hypothetical protein
MDDILATARGQLSGARQAVLAEIRDYPAPIAGCDAQFNHLLDLRRRFERALAELDRPEQIPTPRAPS